VGGVAALAPAASAHFQLTSVHTAAPLAGLPRCSAAEPPSLAGTQGRDARAHGPRAAPLTCTMCSDPVSVPSRMSPLHCARLDAGASPALLSSATLRCCFCQPTQVMARPLSLDSAWGFCQRLLQQWWQHSVREGSQRTSCARAGTAHRARGGGDFAAAHAHMVGPCPAAPGACDRAAASRRPAASGAACAPVQGVGLPAGGALEACHHVAAGGVDAQAAELRVALPRQLHLAHCGHMGTWQIRA
jgi:hypothetical protein